MPQLKVGNSYQIVSNLLCIVIIHLHDLIRKYTDLTTQQLAECGEVFEKNKIEIR